jgi:hypothetical protein
MKDAVATMGAVLPDDAGGRDAVHVAVVSVIADVTLNPGQHVGLVTNTSSGEYTAGDDTQEKIGIVDPFIKGKILRGKRFWLYLYPRTITALSHKWSHPAFPETKPTEEVYAPPAYKLVSERWLRQFAEKHDCPSYEILLEAASSDSRGGYDGGPFTGIINDGEYLTFVGRDAHGDIPPEFWDHVEVVTGKRIKKRAKYFSCSC